MYHEYGLGVALARWETHIRQGLLVLFAWAAVPSLIYDPYV
jgi:hypothetical protein